MSELGSKSWEAPGESKTWSLFLNAFYHNSIGGKRAALCDDASLLNVSATCYNATIVAGRASTRSGMPSSSASILATEDFVER